MKVSQCPHPLSLREVREGRGGKRRKEEEERKELSANLRLRQEGKEPPPSLSPNGTNVTGYGT